MDANRIPFKPNLVRHDLKHILLGYKMEMPDELKICAFQLGNHHYNLMSATYLFICVMIVPEVIPSLIHDFKRGRKATRLSELPLEKYVESDLTYCQKLWHLQS